MADIVLEAWWASACSTSAYSIPTNIEASRSFKRSRLSSVSSRTIDWSQVDVVSHDFVTSSFLDLDVHPAKDDLRAKFAYVFHELLKVGIQVQKSQIFGGKINHDRPHQIFPPTLSALVHCLDMSEIMVREDSTGKKVRQISRSESLQEANLHI